MPAPRFKNTRVEDAYGRLKAELLSNRMPAGYTAPETDIALLLGMSRTPVREALIRLEAEGLVELIPRRGMRVLPVKSSDMAEIYEILSALEPEAAASLAKTKPDAATLAPLDRSVAAMEAALAAQDLDKWAQADADFHQLLLQLHGNQRLCAYVDTLNDQLRRARMVTLRLRETPNQSTQEHRDILNHLLAGDEERTRAAFRAHRQRSRAELIDLLDNSKLGQI